MAKKEYKEVKGVFQYIANLIFYHVGNCKVISCNLIIKKLQEHLSLVCDIIECEPTHILIRADLHGDIALYRMSINERNCIEYVSFDGIEGV